MAGSGGNGWEGANVVHSRRLCAISTDADVEMSMAIYAAYT